MTRAVLIVATLRRLEVAVALGRCRARPMNIAGVPRFVKGMRGQSLDSVREALNKWYAANPDRLQRPVIETIWFEMVVPGLKQS